MSQDEPRKPTLREILDEFFYGPRKPGEVVQILYKIVPNTPEPPDWDLLT